MPAVPGWCAAKIKGALPSAQESRVLPHRERPGQEGFWLDGLSQTSVAVVPCNTDNLQPRIRDVRRREHNRRTILKPRQFDGMTDSIAIREVKPCQSLVDDHHMRAVFVLGFTP